VHVIHSLATGISPGDCAVKKLLTHTHPPGNWLPEELTQSFNIFVTIFAHSAFRQQTDVAWEVVNYIRVCVHCSKSMSFCTRNRSIKNTKMPTCLWCLSYLTVKMVTSLHWMEKRLALKKSLLTLMERIVQLCLENQSYFLFRLAREVSLIHCTVYCWTLVRDWGLVIKIDSCHIFYHCGYWIVNDKSVL